MKNKSHLEYAHSYWRSLLKPGDKVIDATCGNGYDTLFLAELTHGEVTAIDIQQEAILSAQNHLKKSLDPQMYSKIIWLHQSHVSFPPLNNIKLVVYNLGYLPKGDKSKTTLTETTLQSLTSAQNLLETGGCISVTCYPGHTEGKKEEVAILAWAAALDSKKWNCCYHRWLNRNDSPTLLIIMKI